MAMWEKLLPAMVGGTLVDHDAPDEPTEIVGFELEDDPDGWVRIIGEDFTFGSIRKYVGINAGDNDGEFIVRTTFGMAATVTMPKKAEA